MAGNRETLVVYYDGACPRCIADRNRYERLAGRRGREVVWVDITGREERLRRKGIDPSAAVRELHVEDADGRVHRELDAYILLFHRVPLLRPMAWLLDLPGVRTAASRLYRRAVDRRLRREGRMPGTE